MNEKKRVIALGFFDGVHVGHAKLLRRAVEVAEREGASPAVLTFDTHPDNLVAGEKVKLLTSPEDRADIVRRYFGIDELIVVHFDEKTMHMSWLAFIDWLVADFHAVHFVVGDDFHFGHRGEGNPERLRARCTALGLGCDVIEKVFLDGVPVSSTYIRGLLEKGEVERANRFLGHPHSLTDTVRFGYKVGRTMGTPTINMFIPENVLVPAFGVYATRVLIEGEETWRYAVTNVGVRPTLGGVDKVSVESYILNFNENVYGMRVRLEYFSFIRPERKFASVEELKTQILADAESVRAYFGV